MKTKCSRTNFKFKSSKRVDPKLRASHPRPLSACDSALIFLLMDQKKFKIVNNANDLYYFRIKYPFFDQDYVLWKILIIVLSTLSFLDWKCTPLVMDLFSKFALDFIFNSFVYQIIFQNSFILELHMNMTT